MAMISDDMIKNLNDQIREEFNSYWTYQAMAYKFEDMNLKVFAKWFYKQAEEEQEHAHKMAQYVLDQGGEVKLQALDQPKADYKSAEEIVQKAVDHEKYITDCINKLFTAARDAGDSATESFLKWYVDEQVEEVATTTELLDMVKMAQSPGQLFMLENRLWHMVENR